MAEVTQVSVTDLSRVVRAAEAAAAGVIEVNRKADYLANDIARVDNKVEVVRNDLAKLQAAFNAFVKEQRNANNLQFATTEVVRVRQELETKFSKHALARTRLRGILNTTDSSMLREHTAQSCSEQLMLDTPEYWLAPCLVALAAWLSNDEVLAKNAVTEAVKRDAAKTSLLFALVCRRATPEKGDSKVIAARQAACFGWLKTYFDTQNPLAMNDDVIVVVNAWANNLFGVDKKDQCGATFVKWMKIIEEETDIDENQLTEWKAFYEKKAVSTRDTYAALASVAPEFAAADAYLSRINSVEAIQAHFDEIRFAPIDEGNLKEQLDRQLANLVNEFDEGEKDLRTEENHFELIKKFKGDAYTAVAVEYKQLEQKKTKKANFAQRLADAVSSSDPSLSAARKTAIRKDFLGKFIDSSYKEYITEKKDAFPKEITLQNNAFSGWSGKSKDGSNKNELTKSYTEHMNKKREADVAAVDLKAGMKPMVMMFIIAAVAAILAIAINPILFIAPVILVILGIKKNSDAKKAAEAKIVEINQNYDQVIDKGTKLIVLVLDQWAAVLAKVKAHQDDADRRETLCLDIPKEVK